MVWLVLIIPDNDFSVVQASWGNLYSIRRKGSTYSSYNDYSVQGIHDRQVPHIANKHPFRNFS